MNINQNIKLNEVMLEKASNIKIGEYGLEGYDQDLMDIKVEYIINMFFRNLEDTKEELKDYFNQEEALEIVGCFTSTTYTIDVSSKNQLISAIVGHFHYEIPIACFTKEMREKLIEKIKKLSSFQSYVVMYMAQEYLSTATLLDEGNIKLKETFNISK